MFPILEPKSYACPIAGAGLDETIVDPVTNQEPKDARATQRPLEPNLSHRHGKEQYAYPRQEEPIIKTDYPSKHQLDANSSQSDEGSLQSKGSLIESTLIVRILPHNHKNLNTHPIL